MVHGVNLDARRPLSELCPGHDKHENWERSRNFPDPLAGDEPSRNQPHSQRAVRRHDAKPRNALNLNSDDLCICLVHEHPVDLYEKPSDGSLSLLFLKGRFWCKKII